MSGVESTPEDFWQRVSKQATGCWHWNGCVIKDGYGSLGYKGKIWLAHRLAWTLTKGQIPAGKLCLHSCDNPRCVNPEHLFLGSNADNVDDRTRKDRSNKPDGESNPSAKLTVAQVKTIRALYPLIGRTALAIIFKTKKCNIDQITGRRTWRSIPPLTQEDIQSIRLKYATQYT